jgi:CDP-diacylglycerol--glycerol-3-phosphate 3-phosphatidyltransferase
MLATLRIILSPVVVWLIVEGDLTKPLNAAAIVFFVAAASDFLDGWVARKWNFVSEVGVFLDGTADKLLVLGAFVGLLVVDRVAWWVVFIILGREFVIVMLRGLTAAKGVVMPPSIAGKLKANIQFLAIFLALVRPGGRAEGMLLDEWAMVLAVLVTLWSGWGYLKAFTDVVRSPQSAAT